MRPEEELEEMTRVETEDKASRRKPLVDLGWGNGWGTAVPKVVLDCAHPRVEIDLGSCVHQVVCRECGFTYKYDSGDCGT